MEMATTNLSNLILPLFGGALELQAFEQTARVRADEPQTAGFIMKDSVIVPRR
jgi:hypothetical protein